MPDDPRVDAVVNETVDADCAEPMTGPAVERGGVWTATYCGDAYVQVTAPTQAAADVVVSTIGPRPRDPAGWTTYAVVDVALDLPPGWSRGDTQVRVTAGRGVPACAVPAPARFDDGQWTRTMCRDRIIVVTAPTQALADVVALQVRGY